VKHRDAVLLVVATAAGLAIAWIDTRPTWDDTGVTTLLLVVSAALVAAASGRRPWLWGLLIGVWIPLVEIPAGGSQGSFLATVFALVGAFFGSSIAGAYRRSRRREPA
jgi:hypothetical protein